MRLRHFPLGAGLLLVAGALTPATPQGQNGRSTVSEGSLAPGMTINATLKSTIDSKKAKTSDTVTAETTDKVMSADGRTILSKGAKLTGHVTQVEARAKGDKESMVAVQFDKATTKDGQEITLNNVLIQAIAPPATSAAYSPGPGPGAGTPSNNPSMSGSSGGRTGSSTTGTNPPAAYPSTAGQTAGGAQEQSGTLPPNSRGVYGLQGLNLGRTSSGNGESSVVVSSEKNVHLDSGTRLLLVVQPQGSSTTPSR
jgi:hypothetical protein